MFLSCLLFELIVINIKTKREPARNIFGHPKNVNKLLFSEEFVRFRIKLFIGKQNIKENWI